MVASVVQVQWVAIIQNEGSKPSFIFRLRLGPTSYSVQAAGLDYKKKGIIGEVCCLVS